MEVRCRVVHHFGSCRRGSLLRTDERHIELLSRSHDCILGALVEDLLLVVLSFGTHGADRDCGAPYFGTNSCWVKHARVPLVFVHFVGLLFRLRVRAVERESGV